MLIFAERLELQSLIKVYANKKIFELRFLLYLLIQMLVFQHDEFKAAEQMLHVALRLAQQTQNADGITYVYDLLANVAFAQGELDKAEVSGDSIQLVKMFVFVFWFAVGKFVNFSTSLLVGVFCLKMWMERRKLHLRVHHVGMP